MSVSRTLPNVPVAAVASSWASDRRAHASSKRRFAHRLYRKQSASPVAVVMGTTSSTSDTSMVQQTAQQAAQHLRSYSRPSLLLHGGAPLKHMQVRAGGATRFLLLPNMPTPHDLANREVCALIGHRVHPL